MNANVLKIIAVFTFCCATLFGFASAAQPNCDRSKSICIKNISRYVGSGRWDWSIFIDPNSRAVNEIRCVEYTLHPTFPDPVRVVCKKGARNKPYALSTNGWGTFRIKVRVLLKDKRMIELQHQLQFAPRSSRVP